MVAGGYGKCDIISVMSAQEKTVLASVHRSDLLGTSVSPNFQLPSIVQT